MQCRGYVAEMRQKDLSVCFPTQVSGSATQPSLPPLVVQRFPLWSCNVCRGENVFNISDQSDQRTCCERVQETLTHNNVPAIEESEITNLIDLNGGSDDRHNEGDHMPINQEENNDADQVPVNEITGNNFTIITCTRVFYLIYLSNSLLQTLILTWRMILIFKYQTMLDLQLSVQALSKKCMQMKQAS